MTNRLLRTLWIAALMLLLLFELTRINTASPRISAEDVSSLSLSQNQLILLEGGTIEKNPYGGESRYLSLDWADGGCLFLPKANHHILIVNGVEWDDLRDDKLRLFQLQDAPAPDHHYEVEIRSAGSHLDHYGSQLYLGSLAAVSACVSSQIVSRFVVTGICFCVLLFSAVLYAWKRSETYLFWLTLYAFCMLLRTQDALGIGLFIGTESPVFQALDHFVTTSSIFRLIYLLLSAWLNYQVLRYFLNDRLFGRPIILYSTLAALVQFLIKRLWGPSLALELFYFIILYFFQIACIQKDLHLSALERNTLSSAWVLTVVFQIFYTLSYNGVLPAGDVGLKFHIPPIVSCIYLVAFFILACRRFAIKFQEADDLNAHLESLVQEKTREQSLFIRSMLHNLKTPLFSLTGYADMASESLTRPADAQRYLAKVSEKAQYVSHLLDRLFLLMQMDAKQVVFQNVPVQLNELLESVVEAATLKGSEKDIQISLSAAPDAFCMGDPLYLQQAFQNLADNAIEHLGQGGHLEISLRPCAQLWHITFSDNGSGISLEDLPRIFDRYYSNHHGKRSSSGLGLTITKEIIQRHKGSITVTSRPEKGTVFTVRLPRPPEEA